MELVWNLQMGGERGKLQGVLDVASDEDDTIYIVGRCDGQANVLGTTASLACTQEGANGFVARLDERGTPLWGAYLNSTVLADRLAVAVGPDDSVWIAGAFSGMAASLSLSDCVPVTTNGGTDGFVAHLDPTGLCIGQIAVLGGGLEDYAADIVALPNGDVAVTGRFHGTMLVQGEDLPTDLANGDTFVVVLNDMGQRVDMARLAAGGVDEPDVRIAYYGESLFVAGTFEGPFDERSPPGMLRDVFIARLEAANLVLQDLAMFGGVQRDRLLDVAVTGTGPALLVAFEAGHLTVGNQTLTSDAKNLVAIGLDAELYPTFALDLQGSVAEGSLVADPTSNDLLFAVTSIGGLADDVQSDTGRDVYLGRVGCKGQLRWLQRLGDDDAQDGKGAAVLGDGSLVAAGEFAGHILFGDNDTTAGTGVDGFVARYRPK